ncbi:MAG: hypothetical protein ABJF10_13335 [Chthoniobacter sp.]|uniref:hypothetical protein n=1 Tax=Chthoniobacter sp. TaxID=2510640 RepID=UPI0032AC9C2A
MKSWGLILIALVLGFVPAHAKDAPPRCLEPLRDHYIQAEPIKGKQLGDKLPQAVYEAEEGGPPDKARRGNLVWVERPEGLEVQVDRIGVYRGHGIYRTSYIRADEQKPLYCLLLAYSVKVESTVERQFGFLDQQESVLQPFFIAGGGPELDDFEAWMTSTKESPFNVEAFIGWRGTGHAWATFTFRFDESGPRLFRRRDGDDRSKTTTRKY